MPRIAIGLLLAILSFAGPAGASDYYRAPAYGGPSHHFWNGYLPACDQPEVLGRIAEKFAYADRHMLFTGLAIAHIDRIRESDLDVGGPSLIDRRYCHATAWLSDGRKSEVVYLIESRQGFASITWNVESCLPSFDRWRVYDAWCRSIRP
jgi:hypothetical protein